MMRPTPDVQRPRGWSTEDVDQRRALSYWVDTVCDRFLALEIDSPVRDQFRARLDQVDLGAATVNSIQAETQRVRRTQANLARSQHPVFVLMQLREGHVRLQQRGHEVIVHAGESVFIDGTQPYELECPRPTSSLVLRMPGPWLKHWLPYPEHFPARLLTGRGWSAALNAALATVEVDSCDAFALPRDAVADQIAALLALAMGGSPVAQPAEATLFDELMSTLRSRLHEPELSPLVVANQHQMSKRRLYYAFAAANTTFIEQLMRLRLERAQAILSDPRFSDLPVAEVAARCGFMDPSHFARRFRQKFAQPPLHYRSLAIRSTH